MATERPPPPVLLLLLQLLCLCCLHVCPTGECGPGRFGDRCQLQCNCEGSCDVTGQCRSGGCSRGYEGPICQKRNVAIGKQTNSSRPLGEGWSSGKAVDGDTWQVPLDKGRAVSCFHSALEDDSSWWSVDLGAVFPMNNIVIYYRKLTLYRFTGATVNIANSSGPETTCATISSTTEYEDDAIVRLSCPQSGQRLVLRQSGPPVGCFTYQRESLHCLNHALEPCEVQIFVCADGTYGPDCTRICGHCSDAANCHRETGSCLSGSCRPGYRGDKCDQECVDGTFGQDCSGQCGHCSDGASCHRETGSCLSGSCQPGYRGDRCDQECVKGTYGQKCTGQCGHCSDSARCDHETGLCLGGNCQPGYRGDRCDQDQTESTTEQQCPANCELCQRASHASGLGTGVAIGFAACLALTAVSLAVFCCLRRCRRGPGKGGAGGSAGAEGPSQDREAGVHYNAGSSPAEEEGNGQYESLDTASRDASLPGHYVSIGSLDK